jgi:hypothetical protein
MTKFLLSALLVLQQSAYATVWYIDYENGNDSLAGTSTATAWKRFPTDPNATGVSDASVSSILPGDTVAFKAGTTYQLTASMAIIGGTAGNPVIYDCDYWGSGDDCIFTNNNILTGIFTDSGASVSHYVIQDFQIKDSGGLREDNPIYTALTIASVDTATDTITTTTAHGLAVGNNIGFTVNGFNVTGGTLPAPLQLSISDKGISYYVKTVPSATSFTVAATSGGATIDLTTAGTATMNVSKVFTSAQAPGGSGFYLLGGGTNFTIRNGVFTEIGTWQPFGPYASGACIDGLGVYIQNSSDVVLENLSFSKVKTAIALKSQSARTVQNVLVRNCSFTHGVWGIDMSPVQTGGNLANITVQNNNFFGFAVYDRGNWRGFGDKPHTDYMFLRTSQFFSTWNNIVIEKNKFYEDNPALSQGGTGGIFISEGPSCIIRNNLFNDIRESSMIQVGWNKVAGMYQSVEVYNNTFRGVSTCFQVAPGNTNPDRIVFKNNIVWRTTTVDNQSPISVHPPGIVSEEFDNNIYWMNGANPATFKINAAGTGLGGYQTFAQWRQYYPTLDPNSVVANPLLTSTSGAPSTWNMMPLSTSVARTNGIDLSALFTDDYAGVTRTGTWTVGALQYDGAPPADTTAPTVLSASVNSTGLELAVVLSEPVQNVSAAHYALSGGQTLSSPVVSGSTVRFVINPAVQSGTTNTLAYTSGAGRTADLPGNLLATFSGFAVTNDSLESTPVPPRAGLLRRSNGGRINRF